MQPNKMLSIKLKLQKKGSRAESLLSFLFSFNIYLNFFKLLLQECSEDWGTNKTKL